MVTHEQKNIGSLTHGTYLTPSCTPEPQEIELYGMISTFRGTYTVRCTDNTKVGTGRYPLTPGKVREA